MKITTISYTCDICNKEISGHYNTREYSHTTGFAPVDPVGIKLIARAFGDYKEDICEVCAEDAIIAIAEKIIRGRELHVESK